MVKIRNKLTGEIVEVPDQPGMQRVGPANKLRPLQVRSAELGNTKTAQEIAADRQMLPLQIRKAEAELAKARIEASRAQVSPEDQKFLNTMRENTGSIGETISLLRNAETLSKRMDPETARWAKWGTVEDGGGFMDWLGAKIFGGATTAQQKDDYQNLTAHQNDAVLLKQMAQKGPQTESDAVRMQLATLSPFKLKGPNSTIIGNAALNAFLAQRKPEFYTKWANQNGGLNSPDKKGRTVDQAWRQVQNMAAQNFRRSQAPKSRTAKPAQNDGWKIEEVK